MIVRTITWVFWIQFVWSRITKRVVLTNFAWLISPSFAVTANTTINLLFLKNLVDNSFVVKWSHSCLKYSRISLLDFQRKLVARGFTIFQSDSRVNRILIILRSKLFEFLEKFLGISLPSLIKYSMNHPKWASSKSFLKF